MISSTTKDMMEALPYYRAKYEEAKKINVYFIPTVDEVKSEKMFFYAIASASLHDKMIQSLKRGDIPHFAVIVEKGYGDPTTEVKAKIKTYYGFDHDLVANSSNDNESADNSAVAQAN